MVSYEMKNERVHTKGFTLIATLLMLLLLSGIAIGLMMMVNTEGKVGATDLQNDVAFHSAEGGIEKMASDLSSVFQNAQSPSASQICGVSSLQPTMVGVTWKDYSVQPSSGCSGTLTAHWGQISSGPNQGLWAQIIPVSMLATAALTGGQEVSMTRNAQVALIPVFQFGVFSESDLSFFSGPNFDMAGPVHTNADLYPFVGSGSTLTFHSQVSAYGNVIRGQLANGFSAATNYNGTVDIPTAGNGCTTPTTNCTAMAAPNGSSPYGDGSVTGAGSATPQTGGNYNATNWNPFSKVSTNYLLINGNYGSTASPGTGSKKLSMPFVNGSKFPYEIIRRPPAGESASSALGQSREYNLAQIRVLLTDDPAELPGGLADTTNNIRLANVVGATGNLYGIPTSVVATMPVPPVGSSYTTMFAVGFTYIPDPTSCGGTYCATATLPQDWPLAPATPAAGDETLQPSTQVPPPPIQPGFTYNPLNAPPTLSVCNTGTCVYPYYSTTANAGNAVAWNLIDGYLRVEYKDVSGNWNPVTMEWLQLGFARGLTPPTAPGTNPINPNAILLLQEPADRNADGVLDQVGKAPHCLAGSPCTSWSYALPPEVILDNGQPTVSGSPWYAIKNSGMIQNSLTGTNYYPINFYDAREGEARDNTVANNSCTANGVMNAVEIDVGNLKRWLSGAIGTSGASVDYLAQNGYVLYFSDRRGMLPNPNGSNKKTGDSGLEDVINSASAAGTPDNALEPVPAGRTLSPEDVNQNGLLDAWGSANLGLGQYNGAVNINGQIIAAAPDNPYSPRITSCSVTARKNWVSGARHVLRLVDGALGNVPVRTDAGATLASPGGFTVASENPVYVQGHYNTNATDTAWNTPSVDIAGHSSASVIADAVTLLSNNWSDLASLGIGGDGTVTNPANRAATSTRYRLAIAGGKNSNFPKPAWGNQDFGTDGGTHNFLRYLENWGGQVLAYKGSIVSLYYSTYNTGIFKCCTTVYSPPDRNYSFDLDFSTPGGLPPGTPMFRDVESLGYRQLFTARTN